jgi:hypothetical protein
MNCCTKANSLIQCKIMDIPTCFISIIIFFNRAFEYDSGEIIKLLRWMQNLHQLTWDHESLYADLKYEGNVTMKVNKT